VSLDPVVLGASAVLDPPVFAALFGGGGTSRGVLFAGADCNVSGCLASPAGIGATTEASGFDDAGATLTGREGKTARAAAGLAGCTSCWATGSYLFPTYPANAALTPKMRTSNASERMCTVPLLEWLT